MRLANDSDLAAFVRARRRELGLSQGRLAEIAGLRRATVADLERGQARGVRLETATALLDALGVILTTTLRSPNADSGPTSGGAPRPPLDDMLRQVGAQ